MEAASSEETADNGQLTEMYLSINNETYEFTENQTNDIIFTLLDKSQLIMAIIGVIANVGTSITLIKNGQVSEVGDTIVAVSPSTNDNLVHTDVHLWCYACRPLDSRHGQQLLPFMHQQR